MSKEEDRFRESVENVLKVAKNPEAARNTLALLFPKIEKVVQTYVPSPASLAERVRQHRISARDFASTYFRLDPQPASWGRSEIEATLKASNALAALLSIEETINASLKTDRPRLRRLFLEALYGAFGEERPLTTDWLKALVEVSPRYIAAKDDRSDDFFMIDNLMRLNRILTRALEHDSPERRFELFASVIPDAKDLVLLTDFFRTTVGDLHPDGSKNDREPYFGNQTEPLRTILIARLQELATKNSVWEQSSPGRLLWFWWAANQERELRSFTDNAIGTDNGLRALLEVPISLVRSSEGNYERVSRKQWSRIVDLDTLEKKATEILASDASENDRARAKRFLMALERGENSRY